MELGILKLIAGLPADRFEHRFCVTRGYDAEFVAAYGLSNIVDVAAGSRRNWQFPFFRLRQIFRKHQPHIVHTRNWGALEGVPAARAAGIPVVIHSEHGYEVDTLRGIPARQKLFRRLAYAMTDAICAVTDELREFHARQASIRPDSIRVVYNGVDTERFAPDAEIRARVRRELRLRESSVVLGSVGRMVPIKDYGTLLRAADRLVGEGIDISVLLVGDGPELASLKQHVAKTAKLENRVLFPGAADCVPRFLRAMDIFVLPSRGEGMSNTLLEAMACGLPCAATRVGGNPEVLASPECGFLFQPADVESLVDALRLWATNAHARQRVAAAARERILAQFSLESMIARYQALYLNAAAKKKVIPDDDAMSEREAEFASRHGQFMVHSSERKE